MSEHDTLTGRYTDDLTLALDIADRVDGFTMSRFKALDLHIDSKPDLTPVTDADRGAEQLARDLLRNHRPHDAVLGEEQGSTGHGPRQWVIDPIDGTKNYVRGVPVWATLIALMVDTVPVVGVVSAPALGRRWWAAAGGGAWTCALPATGAPPSRLAVSRVAELADASLSYSDLIGWQHRPAGIATALDLIGACWRSRAYGDFWSYMLVAEGAVDIACEPDLALHDVAALVPVVVEAGGRFSTMDGADLVGAGSVLVTNGRLHEPALRVLNAASSTGAPHPA